MEELFGRFPHLSENIFFKLNCQSLLTCREVSRTWNNTIEAESLSYLKVIKSYTQCSDELLNKILEKCGAPIILVSILKEIFSKFPKGTKQSNRYLKKWFITPLHIAAVNGQLAVYELIMENVEDKNPCLKKMASLDLKIQRPNQLFCASECMTEYTPLHLAAKNGNFFICKLIIENVQGKNPPNNRMYTPLHCAAANGHYSIFKLIIENITGNKNPIDANGYTPLHIAAAHGYFDLCCLILSYPESMECLIKDSGQTPYHLAAANGHVEIYRLMMDRNKTQNGNFLKNRWRHTPLHIAATYGHLNICKVILETVKYKDVCKSKHNVDISPIDLAIGNNNSDVEKYLKDQIQPSKKSSASPSHAADPFPKKRRKNL